jgi:hypothetical protein
VRATIHQVIDQRHAHQRCPGKYPP